MTFDYGKLNGKITEVFGTQSEFASAMGWTDSVLFNRLSGKTAWTKKDMCKALEVLKVAPECVQDYFFAVEVQNEKEGGENE